MKMSKEEDKKNVYNQTAWILNYQPKIEHQHIHMGNQTANDDADDVEDDDEYEAVADAFDEYLDDVEFDELIDADPED